jgi:threonine dehydrogenase-like Zn-dependent dehydrogenase
VRVLQCLGGDRVELVERPDPVPGDGEALVRIEASALCGSERGLLATGGSEAIANVGHEAAGVVTWVPEGAAVAVGDRVGISGLRGCTTCDPCRAGRELFCTSGVRPQIQLHADLAAVGLSTLRPLPPGTAPEQAVLLAGDALGVPVRSLRRAPSGPGDRVLVLGLGPVGLSHVLVRVHAGSEVIAVEPSEYRRRLGADLGATVLAPGDEAPTAPLVIEATGVPAVIEAAFERCEPGGTLLQSGECAAVQVRPSAQVIHREVTYMGSWFYAAEDYPAMLDLVAGGLDVGRLRTHVVGADDAQSAVDAFVGGSSGKVVLTWSGEQE